MNTYTMMSVGELKTALEEFPDDAVVEAYEGEAQGIRIDKYQDCPYDETLGFIETYYRKGKNPIEVYRREPD